MPLDHADNAVRPSAALPYEPVGTPSDSAHVVLYTSTFDSQIAVRTLTVLHDFASRQGWTVAHELYDLAPLDLPRRRRTGWWTVERILTEGKAGGVVAPAEQEIAWHPGDRTALRVWLLGVPAFAAYPQAGRRSSPRMHSDVGGQAAAAPVPINAPVDRHWARSYTLRPECLRQVRTDAYTRLTMLNWTGNQAAAVEVLARLAKNVVVHAAPVTGTSAQMLVRLAVTEKDELLIDVSDPSPEFPDCAAAIRGEKGRGLWDVRRLGADVTWILSENGRGKTVRAHLLPGEVPA
ncbi:ATP-binding protein [Streptomyces sp. NPDC059340]|uniref:ATP-binding protein n=1 Tax=Streptomyces sp. NPDC059340 TaxID=3346806 RepID=UPI00368446DA